MTDGADDRQAERAAEFIEGGGDLAGALAGGAVGSLGGPAGLVGGAVAGVAVTRVVKCVGAELYARVFGPRQRDRAGAALYLAVERIRERSREGESPREDGFFEPEDFERSAGEELLEGVLLQAANAYQERKVPYLSSFYASIALRSDISPAYAHILLRLVERLTYRQLVALAFFVENAGSDELAQLQGRREVEGRWPFADGLGRELEDLGGGDLGLLGIAQADGTVIRADRTWGHNDFEQQHELGNVAPTPLGRDVYELMELARIDAAEKRAIFSLLERVPLG